MCNRPPRKFVTRREEEEKRKKGEKGWIFLRQYLERGSTSCQQLIRADNGVERDRNSIPNVDLPPPNSSLEMKQPRKGGGGEEEEEGD